MVTLVGEMKITAEAEVHEGEMVTTPPHPTNTDRKCGAEVRTVGKEVDWRIGND